ncbi:hypothetical protein [Desulfitobacterium hafniense]|uniref:Nucleoside 2-deoxyribosyltransferase n=1 Tax=Desulfitobacterium hafniense (strain Y51) TaxID=138119 RepID=Q24VG1_DESHY|nr:hypothetical protein [Desulfitobacterium hafniense]BAE83981.1 hypothetical protein DSY2192 [Desulfitobacterium hafniense Y51]
MKIYLASSWKNEIIVKQIAEYLMNYGFEVDNFTDDTKGRFVFHYSELGRLDELDAVTFLRDQRALRAFHEDKKWIDWSEAVVLILPAGRSAHLEAGYAKGSGKKLIILSLGEFPKGEFDVMYGFADILTTQPVEIIKFLERMEENLDV